MTPDAGSIFDAATVLREIVKPLQERLDEQQARIEALEQQPIGVLDAGMWSAGTVYEAGDGTTHHGHYWVAQSQTNDEPSDGSRAWRLAVRRGKQGREGQCRCRCAERERLAS